MYYVSCRNLTVQLNRDCEQKNEFKKCKNKYVIIYFKIILYPKGKLHYNVK